MQRQTIKSFPLATATAWVLSLLTAGAVIVVDLMTGPYVNLAILKCLAVVICAATRNPTDKQLDAIRASDGLVGAQPDVHVYQMGADGAQAELHVLVEPGAQRGSSGAGGVHHVAFRTPTFEEYDAWAARLTELGVRSSGPVDRFYFRSLYFREPNGILFEIATDGPGFASDEPMEALGERLALPPFLESRRDSIERGLKPLVTA